jgi:hypothetical protein
MSHYHIIYTSNTCHESWLHSQIPLFEVARSQDCTCIGLNAIHWSFDSVPSISHINACGMNPMLASFEVLPRGQANAGGWDFSLPRGQTNAGGWDFTDLWPMHGAPGPQPTYACRRNVTRRPTDSFSKSRILGRAPVFLTHSPPLLRGCTSRQVPPTNRRCPAEHKT